MKLLPLVSLLFLALYEKILEFFDHDKSMKFES